MHTHTYTYLSKLNFKYALEWNHTQVRLRATVHRRRAARARKKSPTKGGASTAQSPPNDRSVNLEARFLEKVNHDDLADVIYTKFAILSKVGLVWLWFPLALALALALA